MRTYYRLAAVPPPKRYDPAADAAAARKAAEEAEALSAAVVEEIENVERAASELNASLAVERQVLLDYAQSDCMKAAQRAKEQVRRANEAARRAEHCAKTASEVSLNEVLYRDACAKVREARQTAEDARQKVMQEYSTGDWVMDPAGWSSYSCDDFVLRDLCKQWAEESQKSGKKPWISFDLTLNRDLTHEIEYFYEEPASKGA